MHGQISQPHSFMHFGDGDAVDDRYGMGQHQDCSDVVPLGNANCRQWEVGLYAIALQGCVG